MQKKGSIIHCTDHPGAKPTEQYPMNPAMVANQLSCMSTQFTHQSMFCTCEPFSMVHATSGATLAPCFLRFAQRIFAT